jgi:polar amino acid transport system substrate-binding protein
MRRFSRLFMVAALAIAPILLGAGLARAESTLDKIIKEKKIRIACDVASPPFGVTDAQGKFDGSEVATARQLAKDLGVELELVQVPATGRIPALLSGRADVALSSLSITFDRAKAVMFANPNGALSITIFAPKSVNIKSPADLVGKRIGITRATLEEATVPKMAPPGTNIVWFDEIASTIQALLSGQVDAASMSGFAEKTVTDANPDKQFETKLLVTTAYYGAAVRPGDIELLRWIDTWVFLNTQNGVLADIYKKYTGLDLPPLPRF